MNIYFACSITGGREDQAIYQAIVLNLIRKGYQVPTEILAYPDAVLKEGDLSARYVYERDLKWVNDSDSLIAEVSTPSHGVGYEIALALSLAKPVLCCYQEGRTVSKMILGNTNPCLTIGAYKNEIEVMNLVDKFIQSL